MNKKNLSSFVEYENLSSFCDLNEIQNNIEIQNNRSEDPL